MSACGGSSMPSEDFLDPPITPIGSVLTLDQSSQSGITTATQVVARDAASWNTLWTQHKSTIAPPPPVPAVDFSQRMVLAVFIGTRPNGCYGVAITRVTQVNSNTTVEFHESTPQPSSVCTQALTAPTHIVPVPAASGTVQFVAI